MHKSLLLITLIFISSCSSENREELSNWTLETVEEIEYLNTSPQRTQVIYSESRAYLSSSIDTILKIQSYSDDLLLEEIEYNLYSGDTLKWSHHINRYDTSGLLLEEIDSVNGTLRHYTINHYEKSRIERSQNLDLIPNYDDMMEVIGADTFKSEAQNFYDRAGRLFKVITISNDEDYLRLTGKTKLDSTVTVFDFDSKDRRVSSYTLVAGDTTFISKTEYDQYDRVTKVIDGGIHTGLNIYEYEYDEKGNRTSELLLTDYLKELIRTEYDEYNRPIKRSIYRK